ncbi:hypothetical protein TcasGA2_TC031789 [Tribolium castaneum]|uniref:Uncharacterized protein n=1 Tax=Tribolium castaneum TaxID=7070 RepID=A0A139W8I1_TRICA|nr:hypothetical protein TcasGA2_TC031789 [Tribolium castaneum]
MAMLLRLGTILKYLNGTADSRCVVEGEEIISAKLLLCGVTKIECSKYSIAGLCLQTSALSSAPHEIKGELLSSGVFAKLGRFDLNAKVEENPGP